MAKLKIRDKFSLNRLDLVVKGLTNTAYLGNYKSVFKGTGLEFADYRLYSPSNDDSSRIDWKASKRVGQIVVKEFEEERNLDVIFLIDVSSPMLSGSTEKLKAEYVAEMVSTLSQNILSAGDSVGYVLFSNKIIKDSKPQNGLAQYHSLTKDLVELSNYGGYSDIGLALDHAFKRFDEGSLIILVSDFIYGINSDKLLRIASKKFDLILTMVRDPRDISLPEGHGQVILEDPYSGSTLLVSPDQIRGEYKKQVLGDIAKFKSTLQKYGADFLFLQTDKPFVKEVIKFFKRRALQWR